MALDEGDHNVRSHEVNIKRSPSSYDLSIARLNRERALHIVRHLKVTLAAKECDSSRIFGIANRYLGARVKRNGRAVRKPCDTALADVGAINSRTRLNVEKAHPDCNEERHGHRE